MVPHLLSAYVCANGYVLKYTNVMCKNCRSKKRSSTFGHNLATGQCPASQARRREEPATPLWWQIDDSPTRKLGFVTRSSTLGLYTKEPDTSCGQCMHYLGNSKLGKAEQVGVYRSLKFGTASSVAQSQWYVIFTSVNNHSAPIVSIGDGALTWNSGPHN